MLRCVIHHHWNAERRWKKGPGGYPIKLLHFCVIYNVATQKICVM